MRIKSGFLMLAGLCLGTPLSAQLPTPGPAPHQPPTVQLPPAAPQPPVARPPQVPAQATPAPARVQATPAPAATPAAAPLASATLERIRIVRSMVYTQQAAQSPGAVQVGRVEGATAMQEYWMPGLMMQFDLRPPQGWSIVDLDTVNLMQAVTQSGTALQASPISPGGRRPGPGQQPQWVIPVSVTPERATLQVNVTAPPKTDTALAMLRLDFLLTVGQKQPMVLRNASSYAGKPLSIGAPGELTLLVEKVGEDYVEISATGQIEKVGDILVLSAANQQLTPYSTEVRNAGSGNARKRTWSLAFSALPKDFGLTIETYPVRAQTVAKIEAQNVPLP